MDKKVPVRNRTKGAVGYKLDSLRMVRSWPACGDTLYIPIDELKEVMVTPGGGKILRDFLIIQDKEAQIEILGAEPEPEYNYTEKEIQYLLYEAEDDALLDCLDYAPQGVLNLIKEYSIRDLPNTTVKLDAITERLKTKIIKVRELSQSVEELGSSKNENKSKRRTKPIDLSGEKKRSVVIIPSTTA